MSDEDDSYDEDLDSDEEEDEEDSDEEGDEEDEEGEENLLEKQRKVAVDLERLNEVCQQMDHVRLRLRRRYPLPNVPNLDTYRDGLVESNRETGNGPKIPPLPLSGVGKSSRRNRNEDEVDAVPPTSLSRRSSRSDRKSRRNSSSGPDPSSDLNQYGPSSNVDGRYYSGGPSSRRTSTAVKFARNSETQTESARSRNSMSQTESVKKRDSSMQTMSPDEFERSEKKLQEGMDKVVTSLASSTFSLSGRGRSSSQQSNSSVQMFTTDDLEASGSQGRSSGRGRKSNLHSNNNMLAENIFGDEAMGGPTSAGNIHRKRGNDYKKGRKNTMKEFDMYSHDSLDDEEENYRHMSPMKRNELIQQAIKVLLAEDGMVDGRQGINGNGRAN